MNQDNNQLFENNYTTNNLDTNIQKINEEIIPEPVEELEEKPKSKIIVLDEDPVKFEVKDVESPIIDNDNINTNTYEEKTESMPTEQSGNIQF